MQGLDAFNGIAGADLHSALANVDQECIGRLLAFAIQRHRDFEAGAMVAQASVEDHAAGGGKRAHGLFHGYGFFKGENRATIVEILVALWPAHNHQRHCLGRIFGTLQFAQELCAAVQIAIHNERVDFIFVEPGHGPLRLALDGHVHVKTAEDALQNADFLPITGDHHRGKCHVLTVAGAGNADVDNQRNEAASGVRSQTRKEETYGLPWF